uniref:AB hydrolase-1 domain-containing protein n=1 Tax=Zooxanthella nutricula TaxID=1333877 RepID=A0A7S2K855_9DINO
MVHVQESPVVVIALHPWGPLGGSMDDPHPTTVCRTLGKAGCSTVRFNFRSGVGSGEASVADVRGVAAWFVEPHEGSAPLATQVLVVGYSYGSIIGAAAAADIPQCVGFAVLGPPLDYGWALYVLNASSLRARAARSAGRPKLVMAGSADQFCSERTFSDFAAELPEPKKAIYLQNVDHFSLFRRLPQALTEWVVEAFGVKDIQEFGRSGAPAGVRSPADT